jgi:hypothetical protein
MERLIPTTSGIANSMRGRISDVTVSRRRLEMTLAKIPKMGILRA